MWGYLRRPVDEEVGQALLLCAVMLTVGFAGPVFAAAPSSFVLWVLGAVALYRLTRRKVENQLTP
jgi:hypothetical protein